MGYTDITKTGARNFIELQLENDENFQRDLATEVQKITSLYDNFARSKEFDPFENAPQKVRSSLYGTSTSWGESIFDKDTANANQFEQLADVRAKNQPWIAKLGAGLGKGVSLAGTTFLDGTVGLVVGGIEAIAQKDISKLWDNEISNGLQEFNRQMEEWLPNYRTEEEQNNAWYENLGTINFWADSFLKNMGFTVGALYSGGVYTKGLKLLGKGLQLAGKGMQAVNVTNKATKAISAVGKNTRALGIAMQTNGVGAKFTGALFSAVNEGRIEANHTVHDLKDLQVGQAYDAFVKRREEIAKDPTLTEEERIALQDELNRNYEITLAQIDENLKKVGLTDFLINVPILAIDNFWTFGRSYAQGFRNARTVAGNNVKKSVHQAANEAAAAAESSLVQQTKKIGSEYIWNTITNKKVMGKGLLTGLREGNEEMAQALAASFAGNLYSYKDSPDTYYRAMTDPKALQETSDVWSALAKGFAETYGNGDRYEEFAVGFLTGLLGTPTFGSSQNAGANTWAGRGKFLGISGGLGGEIAVAKEENRLGKEHVAQMNKLVKKIEANKGLLAASKKYTDAMHAWAEENDAFEYKNNEDNEDWRAITSFLATGRKADLMTLINQDFESTTDEELAAIAAFTTPEGSTVGSGGWRDASGHLITADSSQEDKDNMRKALIEKRDKLKNAISNYEESLTIVRNLVNGSKNVSEDEVNELAWLYWKMGRFTDRYNEIISDEKNKDAYRALDQGLNNYEQYLRDQLAQHEADIFYSTEDTQDKQAQARVAASIAVSKKAIADTTKSLNNIKALRSFLQTVVTSKGSKKQIVSAQALKANLDVLNELMKDNDLYTYFIEGTGMPQEDINESLRQLQDLGRLSEAFSQFNKRFSEFVQDPNKLRANRQKIDQENVERQEIVEESSRRKKARNIPITELKSMDDAELDELLSSLDENNSNDAEKLNAVGAEIKKRKVGEAIRNQLLDMEQDSEDEAETIAIQAALTKLEKAQSEADSAEELTDLENEIYQGLTRLEEQYTANSELEDAAFGKLAQAMDAAVSTLEEMDSMHSEESTSEEQTEEKEPKEVGKDSVVSTPPVNTPKKQNRKKTAEEKNKEKQEANKKKHAKYVRKQQKKEDSDKKAKANETIMTAATEVLKQLSGEVEITQEVFGETLNLVSRVFTELEGASSTEEVSKVVSKLAVQDEWQDFKEALGVPINEDFLLYIVTYVHSLSNDTVSEPENSAKSKESRVGIQTQTPDLNIDSDGYDNLTWSPVILGSWMSLVREYPIHGADITPYHTTEAFKKTLRNKLIQEGVKGKALEDAIKAEVKRLTAVYDYLKAHNAFSNASKVKAPQGRQQGTKVYFVVDSTLNGKAGETVILMSTDPEGKNIVGAVRGNNEIVSEQTHLQSFINRTVSAYEEYSKSQDASTGIWASSETTHVAQVFPGKVLLSEKSYNLNEIYTTGTDTNAGTEEFMLGIYMPDGSVVMSSRTQKGSRTRTEKKAKTPYRRAVPGQPFLMVPAGEGIDRYIPVPIHMNLFSPQMSGSKFAQFVAEHIQEVWDDKTINQKKTQTAIKLALEDLFSHEFHVNVQGGKFKVAATMKDGKQRNIYETSLKDASTESLLQAISNAGLGIQINRKYVNDVITIGGQEVNYNEVIGELAYTNIAPGFGHTVNDFFTLNPINYKKQEEKAEKLKGKDDATSNENVGVNRTQVTVDKTVYYLKEDDVVTDASGRTISVDSDTLVKIKAAAEIAKNNLVSIDAQHPTIYHTSYGFYDTKTSQFVNGENTTSETSSNPVTAETIGDYIQITKTSQGYATLLPINEWNKKVSDMRKTTANGWYNHNGLTYYIEFGGGRSGDNVTIWFKNAPSAGIKRQIELFFKNGNRLNDYTTLAKILNGETVFTEPDTEGTPTPQSSNTSSGQANVSVGKNTVERITTVEEEELSQADIDEAMTDKSEGVKVKSFKFSGKKEDTPSVETPSIPKVFNTKQLKEMFNALTPEQQAAVAGLSQAMQRQVMNKLKLAYKGGKFNKNVDDLISPTKFRVTDVKAKKSNLKQELEWLDKVLPQLSREQKVAIIEGLIEVSGSPDPLYAWGKFQNGIITLSSDAAKGTVYHEAFHYVSQTLLSDNDLETLYKEGAKKYKITNIDEIEEKLAEEYRKYVQLEQIPILGSVLKIFRKLKHKVLAFFGNETFTNNLFYRISSGEFANQQAVRIANKERASVAYTEEMNKIKEKAIKDGTFMKAPDGNPTNLDERQWLQVRTKAFINWFGDWINDPENASKVIDENGEPLVVYHGSSAKNISEFRTSGRGNVENRGVYFTPQKEFAEKYGRNIYEVFLSIKNPLSIDYQGLPWTNIGIDKVSSVTRLSVQELEETIKPMTDWSLADYITNLIKTPTISNDKKHYAVDQLMQIVAKHGYDGLMALNTKDSGKSAWQSLFPQIANQYVVPKSNQIKSATDNIGTFSTENNDIRYRLVEGIEDTYDELPTKQEMIAAVQEHVNDYIVEAFEYGYTSRHGAVNKWGLLVDEYRRKGFIIKAKNPTLRGKLNFTITDVTFSPELKAAMQIQENRQKKFAYKYLSSQQKAKLRAWGINEWTYNTMTTYEKEEFWRCRR